MTFYSTISSSLISILYFYTSREKLDFTTSEQGSKIKFTLKTELQYTVLSTFIHRMVKGLHAVPNIFMTSFMLPIMTG